MKQFHPINPHDHFARRTFVIPLVIYHGDKPWDEPTSLRDKIPATRQLSGFIPDMQAIVIDFSRQSPDIFSQTLRTGSPHPHITTRPSRGTPVRLRRRHLQTPAILAGNRFAQRGSE
ncbi:MAG UNVERIFIED_CONTAM: Rpn family recombination-promoting nuclease/putative transposase [Planctomycetaceae bacterium]